MKKFVAMFVVCAMAIVYGVVPVSAATTTIETAPVEINAEISLADSSAKIRALSAEEAAMFIATKEECSYTAALDEVKQNIARGTGYHEATIIKNFGKASNGVVYADWTVEVGAVFQTATGSGHSNFVGEPIHVWSQAVSSGEYTWEESYEPIAEIRGATNNSVYLMCRGVIVITRTVGIEGSIDINVIEDLLGFSVSTSTSGEQYYRKTGTVSGTYTMSGYN